ncbi:hypothetical protein BLX24_11425 [Arsenicibacter rosenii]|uniref:Signal transduction histidine kinase internal region domain-containing protein n=2 Tax=Arsenicibacter rosenii TaxID=1750698 RepID=A0A1S2VK56_9BACT|nr:hypothetical protein BLX24_11425 [Arsenicibacter rosenii]
MQVVVLPVYVIGMNWLLLGAVYWQSWRVWAGATVLAGMFSFGNWLLNNIQANWVRDRFSAYSQILGRSIVMAIWLCLLGAGFTVGMYKTFIWFGFTAYDGQRLQYSIYFQVIVILIILAIHESIFAFDEWQQTVTETERLKKARLQSQFESLKQQINPHFLFNSLNTLSVLIEDSPKTASRFLDEMSHVYRYLLRANEEELTELRTELAFVRSYVYLLQIRHGDGFAVREQISDAWMDYRIAPLTLQLLVENAVKHNVILPEQQLVITMTVGDDGLLRVQNNLQRRAVPVVSDRVGLSNIVAKYRLLGDREVQVVEAEGNFNVVIPLLEPEKH